MNRNSGKKESSVENSESKHDWNIPRVAAIFEDGGKNNLLKMDLLRQKMDGMALAWNSLPSRS